MTSVSNALTMHDPNTRSARQDDVSFASVCSIV